MIDYVSIPDKYDTRGRRMFLKAACDWWVAIEDGILMLRVTENRHDTEPTSIPICLCHFTPHWVRCIRSESDVAALLAPYLLEAQSKRGYVIESDRIAAYHELMMDQAHKLKERQL